MKRLILGLAVTAAIALGVLTITNAFALQSHAHGQSPTVYASTGYGMADGSVRFLR